MQGFLTVGMAWIGMILTTNAGATHAGDSVAGRARANDGKPLSHVTVYWVRGHIGEAELVRTTLTDEEGRFVFSPRPKAVPMKSDTIIVDGQKLGLAVTAPYQLDRRPDVFLSPPTDLIVPITDMDGKPLARVRLRIDELQVGLMNAAIPDALRTRFEGESDDHGMLVFHDLPQGANTVLANDDLRFTLPGRESIALSQTTQSYTSTRRLDRAGKFIGSVLDAKTEKPVAGLHMTARNIQWGTQSSSTTDAEGKYRFEGLAPGAYRVTSDSTGEVLPKQIAYPLDRFPVANGDPQTAPPIPAFTGGVLSGTVSSATTGKPMGDIVVRATPADDASGIATTTSLTGAEGKYHFRLMPGKYNLSIRFGTPVAVEVSDNATTTRDVALPEFPPMKPGPIRSITVHVVDPSGKGVPFAEVNAEDRSGFMSDTVYRTDETGTIVLRDSEARSPLTLQARAGKLATKEPKTFVDEHETTLHVSEVAFGSIEGRVLDAKGSPVEGMSVMLFVKSGQFGRGTVVARSDKEGRYRFDDLWPDRTYSAGAQEPGWTRPICGEVQAPLGKTTPLEALTVGKASGSLAGRVVDQRGDPIAAASVSVNGGNTVLTDAKGGFKVTGIGDDAGSVEVSYDATHNTGKSFHGSQQDLVVVLDLSKKGPDGAAAPAQPTLVGKPAFELAVSKTLDGKPISIASLKGHVVVIDFWGIHCGPCIGALPGVERLWQQFRAKGVTVIGLHTGGESVADVQKFVHDKGLTYPIVIDEDDSQLSFGKTFRKYGVFGIPSIAVIDAHGTIVGVDMMDTDAFNKVGELLTQKS